MGGITTNQHCSCIRENRQRSNATVRKIKCDVVIITAMKRGQDVAAIRRRCDNSENKVTV